jgi:hypothetical protein
VGQREVGFAVLAHEFQGIFGFSGVRGVGIGIDYES